MAQGNIYKFTLEKQEKQKVEVERKNKETGETETVLQNKTIKTPIEFVIKKPTRRIIDEAEAQYAIELSKNIKKGIVTKDMMVKKYADTGGNLTEQQVKDTLRKVQKSNELTNKIQLLTAANKKENKEEIEKLEQELLALRKDLIEMEMSMQGVYEHTADSRAERSVLLWYTIQLAKKIVEGEERSFFDGIIYEDQLEDLYKKDESENEIEKEALSNFMLIVSYWFYNNNATEDEIKEFLENQKSE